jgi:hypothetical protein
MPGDTQSWGTNEWEDHVQLLLKRKYRTPGTYQHVPADTNGDHGIEGYAIDGTAYQCYSAQNWIDSKSLYEKQRNKMTEDINKFITNETELVKLLGSVRIKIWNFMVPYYSNKDIIKHAKIKEALVRASKLAHADKDFTVSVITEDDFSVERQELASAGLSSFQVSVSKVPQETLDKWLQNANNVSLVSNLNYKAAQIIGSDSGPKLTKFRLGVVRNYINGDIVLKRLEHELPDTFNQVQALKDQKESDLDTETTTLKLVPSDMFHETLKSYQAQLSKTPGLAENATRAIANEAVADWLLRCPLEF